MEQREFGGKMLEIDEDGFIQDPDAWDKAVAEDLAKTEGVEELTEELTPLAERTVAGPSKERHHHIETVGLLMSYPSTRKMELNELLESFSKQLKGIGATVQLGAFEDV